MPSPIRAETLLEKLQDLPADKLAQVEDFVDSLRFKRRAAAPEDRLRLADEAEPNCAVGSRTPLSSVTEAPRVKTSET